MLREELVKKRLCVCVCVCVHIWVMSGRQGGPCGWNSGEPAFDCLSYQLYSSLWTFFQSLLTFVDLKAGERSVRTGEEYICPQMESMCLLSML